MRKDLDLYEYATDLITQAAYVSNDITGINTVDQQQLTAGEEMSRIFGETGTEEMNAQSFIPSGAITVYSASVYLKKFITPTDDIIVRIETDSGGSPSGTLVDANATKTIATASLTSAAFNEFIFPATFSLSASTTYWIVVSRSGARDTVNYWAVWGTGGDPYANGKFAYRNSGTWTYSGGVYDAAFKITRQVLTLQDYSESTIKTQGDYSLKGIAAITDSLNKTLTRTVSPTIDLSGLSQIKFDIRSSRTGSNIKIGLHDSGGTTTEITPNILSANIFQEVIIPLKNVTNANKDVIDSIIITIVNADEANTFYLDNMLGLYIPQVISIG